MTQETGQELLFSTEFFLADGLGPGDDHSERSQSSQHSGRRTGVGTGLNCHSPTSAAVRQATPFARGSRTAPS